MTTIVNGILSTCCADKKNLVVKEQRGDITIRVCVVCNRRHFELSVDTIPLGLKGTDV
jgi:hypothetical protein